MKNLVIRIERDDIRAALKDAIADKMLPWTITELDVDRCIESLKKEYLENYADDVYEFTDGMEEDALTSHNP